MWSSFETPPIRVTRPLALPYAICICMADESMDTDCGKANASRTGCITKQGYSAGFDSTSRLLSSISTPQGDTCPQTTGAAGQQLAGGETRKRVREGEGKGEVEEVVEKRGCEEGMSWWTCLMLGMDQENARPRVVRKVHPNHN